MEEFLESIKSETKDLFRSKRNLINLLILVILILALPVSVNSLRHQQIIKSRAAVDPITFTGPNVRQKNDGSWVATKPQIQFQLISPLAPSDGPSPTPSPSFLPIPTPTPRSTVKSKLGFQTAWQKPAEMEFIETAKPVVVKLLDGFNHAAEIKQKSPETFIIGRIWEQNQPVDGNPETRAQEWFDRNRGTLGTGGIDCWEGYNEPPTNHSDEVSNMQWYSLHEIKRMQLLESIGKKACIGNFSVGNPDFPLWPYFRDAMDYASFNGHYLGLHEYGPTSMSDRADYFSLRHRIVYRDNGFNTPLIISETGIDENGNQDTGGWRAHTTAGDYFDQLKWYDDRLQEDSYVKGATIFSYGLYGWNSFEIYPELTGDDGRSGPLTVYIQ